jgi:hypothetical protein
MPGFWSSGIRRELLAFPQLRWFYYTQCELYSLHMSLKSHRSWRGELEHWIKDML